MDFNEIDDNELVSLISENDENIRNIIYQKYSYLVDTIIKKYHESLMNAKGDFQELRCEAYYGFSDGINSYSPDKCASLKTFLYICIERRVLKYLRKISSDKSQILKEAISFDYIDKDGDISLAEVIGNNKNNPLNNISDYEYSKETINLAKNNLSEFEYSVFVYMLNGFSYNEIAKVLKKSPKQIDNAIQRIKIKMKELMTKAGLL